MSIATVVTMGYGSFGSVNKLPTLGYTVPSTSDGTYGCAHGLQSYHAGGTALQTYNAGASEQQVYQAGGTAIEKVC